MSNAYEAPESNLVNENKTPGEYGSVEKAINGEYEFSIGSVLSEAWEKTRGSKLAIHMGFFYYFLVVFTMMMGFGFYTMGSLGTLQSNDETMMGQILAQLAVNIIGLPMVMGLVMMGIKRSVDAPISGSMVFHYFSKIVKLFVTMIMVYAIVLVGLLLLVLPGIYLLVAYYMSMSLVVEKNMSPWQAMEASRKAITHRWFSVFALFIILVLIVIISIIPLGIGTIWSLPMMMVAYGILYRNMFGVEAQTSEA